jgi:hypothetical protein
VSAVGVEPRVADMVAGSEGHPDPTSGADDAGELAAAWAEVARLRAEVARLTRENAALLRSSVDRNYERPPHYE